MANLLDLSFMPFVQENILQHLRVRDIKALRLTCRETCNWVHNANVNDHWGGVSATVDLKRKGAKSIFDKIATLPFTVSNLTLLNCSSPKLLHVNDTGRFLERKGYGVKTLRLEKFYGCRFDDENIFIERLTALEELFVCRLELESIFEGLQDHSLRIPPTIRKLRNLEFQNQVCNRTAILQFWELIAAPRLTRVLQAPIDFDHSPEEFLGQILLTLQQRRNLEHEEKVNYTHVDLSSFTFFPHAPASNEVRHFLTECFDNSVLILNVPPVFLVDYNPFIYKTSIIQEAQQSVESILGWHWALKDIRSATIKEIRIPSTNLPKMESRVPDTFEMQETYVTPNLKLLQVTFDTQFSMIGDVAWCIDIIRALHLGPFSTPQSLAQSNGSQVNELSVKFLRDHQNKGSLTPPGVICPASIALHYPNIRILRITGWDADDLQWNQLWKGLHNLEEVHIDDCRNLSDVGFIGNSSGPPLFSKFKNLKKMTMKLNNMPRITDHLFRSVISHLPLEELYLHSKRPRIRSFRNLSRLAMEALANGPFGRNVKKFPFDTFALTGITAAEQKPLKRRFPTAHF